MTDNNENNKEFLDQLRSIDDNKISMEEISDIDVGNCSICYEKLKLMIYEDGQFKANPNISTTPCGHTFCYSCLSKHLEKKNTCPLCRYKIMKKTICRPISSYEGCFLINQKIDFHLTHKLNLINLASQQLEDPNLLLSTIKYCMYDLMQTFRRLQIVETSDDEENDEL